MKKPPLANQRFTAWLALIKEFNIRRRCAVSSLSKALYGNQPAAGCQGCL